MLGAAKLLTVVSAFIGTFKLEFPTSLLPTSTLLTKICPLGLPCLLSV